jgi:SAM-dependent methyltransferase
MRVLDLGCGRAASSIFMRREFGVQVWATDLWFSVSENIERIRDAGVEDGVFPIHADARSLPFAAEFFDAIVSVDSFCYYGTDDLYLAHDWRRARPIGFGRFLGLCPLHADHEPSFLVDPNKNLFHCYGCRRGGDIIRFVELYHQVKVPRSGGVAAPMAWFAAFTARSRQLLSDAVPPSR